MELLDKLTDKNYIKNLNKKNVSLLAQEIRKFLIKNVSETGGHLASNLGVVELTIALYKVFDFPNDKIIYDVGHQSYVHKILSGRHHMFQTLRQLNGLSGFPKTEESEYDSFNTGHSSTSISAAFGMAKARDLSGDNYNVIAFIGDGALGGGMAFEALNSIGGSRSKIIIILNDNEMSINKNVGGLSAYLSMLRLGNNYISAKDKMHNVLGKTGVLGNAISKTVHNVKKAVKYAAIEAPMFEQLGLKYIGIIDGHNFDELTDALEKAKNIDGPVIIHTFTKKGRGYKQAEENPDLYHGIPPKNMDKLITTSPKTYTDFFGNYISKKAYDDNNIVAITAAMCSGCGLTEFAANFPSRFFDVGIAEQHAVTFAAGLAINGYKPFVCIYSTFLQRAYDQIIHDVCMQNLNVVFAIDRAGIVGQDGETHQGIFDLSYLLHIPNLTVLAPACESEFSQMLDYAVNFKNGPIAIRYPRSNISNRKCSDFSISKPEIISVTGDDVLLIGVGRMTDTCIEVANILNQKQLGITVVNLRTVKPFDVGLISEMVNKCKITITVEDNIINGGAGCYIATSLEFKLRNKIINLGFNDCFVQQGTQNELFNIHNLTPVKIAEKIEKEIDNIG